MPDFIYTPIGGQDIDLGKYSPGLQSEIAGKWGVHPIPGQRGSWKEDLGDGDLTTQIRLQFVGKTAADYYKIVPALSKNRQGTLLHPRRGARQSIIRRIREEIQFVERGNNTTIVDLTIEDRVVGEADSYRSGPSALTQKVLSQVAGVQTSTLALHAVIFSRPNLIARSLMIQAETAISVATSTASSYAVSAQESFAIGVYDPTVQSQLLTLTPQAQEAIQALRLVSDAADIQETVLGIEVMLFAATQLDIAIRAAEPIPIETVVTRSPGQTIYGFVQQCYGRSGKRPADLRAYVGLILRLNPHVRRPLFIPAGTVLVRPVT